MHNPLAEARRWLEQAAMDLRAGELLSDPVPSLACFHAQQAAEKALKAILYAAGERVVLGHSLGELSNAVVARSGSYEKIRSEVVKLDRYYVPTRYPNGLPPGTPPGAAFDTADARTALATSRKALDHAQDFLKNRERDQEEDPGGERGDHGPTQQ